jgi:hypothetical protein
MSESPKPTVPGPSHPGPSHPDPDSPGPTHPVPTNPDPDSPGPANPEPEGPTSGLRNPQAAVRGVAMGTLILESIVVLLAIAPIKMMSGITGTQLVVLSGLAVVCLLVCGLLRRPWGWHVGTALQVAVTLTGFYTPAMFVLGIVFLLIWVYLLRLRVTVSKPAQFDH